MAVERLEAVPFVVVFSLKVFADAARRKKVKRLSSTAEKKKRKKKKNEDTSLSFSSLSLSLRRRRRRRQRHEQKVEQKVSSFSSSSFFLRCVGRGKKGRRGFIKGRRNEEKAYGSLNILSFFFFVEGSRGFFSWRRSSFKKLTDDDEHTRLFRATFSSSVKNTRKR